jgi:glycosyltransferase involved in cell wall biosynthesis
MRVVFIGEDVLQAFPLAPDRVGRWLAGMLVDNYQAEVHYLCFAPHLKKDWIIQKNNMTIHYLACHGLWPFNVRQYFALRKIMDRALKRIAPDVVHSQFLTWAICTQDMGIPTVATIHQILHQELPLRKTLRHRLVGRFHLHYYWKALRKIRHIISISPYVEKELGPHTNATFWNVPNPINPTFFDLDTDRQEPGRLLFVGHLMQRKCILELLQAFRNTYNLQPDARLRIIGKAGNTNYLRQLKEYIAKEGLQKAIVFLGSINESELLDEFTRASILVLMSKYETAPGVISEAMASGTAVIATRICGIPYMVEDGKTGLLAERDDIEGFSKCLSELVGNHKRCQEMGRKGRQKAQNEYHPKRVVDATFNVYRQIIEKR